jgi:hypothetical protein
MPDARKRVELVHYARGPFSDEQRAAGYSTPGWYHYYEDLRNVSGPYISRRGAEDGLIWYEP